jgi:myo-inositol 2-dehydrogenase/D-chiro-inositol 1-dehydrogenase/scyllo-inositol 2-dehydrogenase (NAD+)
MIGCGVIGFVHAFGLGKLAEEGEIIPVAAADPSEEGRERVKGVCGFERFLADGTDLPADPGVDAVLITAPTTTHAGIIRATLNAGKPLFCEKPLATEFGLVRQLTLEVLESGLPAQVGFHSRFHPLFNSLKAIIDGGSMGRPMGYALRDDQFWPTGAVVPGHSSWRSDASQAGGGALLEHSIHSADIISWLFGQASRVFATTRHMFGYDVEDVAALTIEHANGVVGNLLTIFSGMRGREERRLEVFFEHGVVELTSNFLIGAKEDSMLLQRPDSEAERLDVAQIREDHLQSLGISRRDLYFYQYVADRAWVHAIRSGRKPSPDFADAFRSHALVEAAYRSAARGQPVALVDDLVLPLSTGT